MLQQQQQRTHTQPFNGRVSGTTRVGRYQKKHSPTDTHPNHRTSFIIFLHVLCMIHSILLVQITTLFYATTASAEDDQRLRDDANDNSVRSSETNV